MEIRRATRHAPRSIALQVDSMPDGRLRVSTPQARGWAAVVRGPDQLARAVGQAFVEAQIAAYARWRGEAYDLDDLTEPVPGDSLAPPRSPARPATNGQPVGWGRNQQRPDLKPIEHWERLPDGGWRSPAGRRYGPQTVMASRVVARRRAAGMPD